MANPSDSEFDSYSTTYQDDLQKGLDLAGESSTYFAEARVAHTRKRLASLDASVNAILDFGCGTGGSVPYLLAGFPDATVVGTDPSEESLNVAREQHIDPRASFVLPDALESCPQIDLAYCNGVFHHILPSQRDQALRRIFDCLKPGGLFAFWENNPWNPGTRLVMSRIPFDRDAITISPHEAPRLLQRNGFTHVTQDYTFWFPRMLAVLRPLERLLVKVPLGAQYLVLCKKPDE